MAIKKNKFARKVALLVDGDNFGTDYRTQLYRGVLLYAREHLTLDVFVNTWKVSLEHPTLKISELRGQGVEGVFCISEPVNNPELASLRDSGILVFNIWEILPGFPTVRPDNMEAGRVAARAFLERGFRSFGYVGYGREQDKIFLGLSEERRKGFQETLRVRGYSCPAIHYEISRGANSSKDQATAVQLREWLRELPQPVGILAYNDIRGLHILEACKRLGLAVPSQVGVIGIENDTFLCEMNVPSLSSVDLNLMRVGYEAAGWMERLLNGEKPFDSPILVPPRGLVMRMSSNILAVDDPVVVKALEFIYKHLAESFTEPDVARHAGVSLYKLHQHLKKVMGERSIHDIITQLRLEKAQRLLQMTNLSVDAVAHESGFRRATYLSNIFEIKLGISPGKWREKNRGIQ